MRKNMKLSHFRLNSGLTLKEMADRIGVSKSYYEKIEAGMRNPSFNFIEKFKSKFIDVDADSLFFNVKAHETCNDEIASQQSA